MALFTQKMDQLIPAKHRFIQAGGNIPELSFCTDLIEKGGQQPGQLFDQVVHRCNVCVEKFGNVPGEQVRVPDKDTTHGQGGDQRRQQAFADFFRVPGHQGLKTPGYFSHGPHCI